MSTIISAILYEAWGALILFAAVYWVLRPAWRLARRRRP